MPEEKKKPDKFIVNPMGGRLPVKDIELVDKEQDIWKGTLVDFPNRSIDDPIAYFSRHYDREHNDLDKCLEEYHMPSSVNGFDFWLIPKEKFLCSVMPQVTEGGIVLPMRPRQLRPRVQM